MNWDDSGYLVSKNRYNENSIIAEFYTKNHGKVPGIYTGGSTSRVRSHEGAAVVPGRVWLRQSFAAAPDEEVEPRRAGVAAVRKGHGVCDIVSLPAVPSEQLRACVIRGGELVRHSDGVGTEVVAGRLAKLPHACQCPVRGSAENSFRLHCHDPRIH